MLLAACAGKPGPPQKKQIILATEYHDQKAGAEAAQEIAQEMGVLPDTPPVLYAKEVGKRVARFAPESSFEYRIEVVDEVTPNAFALPGGYIYLSRGLLALTNSEDELANVIAHEITHAVERHAAGRQAYEQRLNPFAMGYMRAAQIAAYGRDQERDADRGAQRISALAGYDPVAMASILRGLDDTTRLEIGFSRIPGFFDTHPATPERASTAAQRAETLEWQRKPGVSSSRADHLRRLEGLVLGQNPAEGVFIDNRFIHVDLDFSLRFPPGWDTVNTHAALIALSPDGDAQAVLRVVGDGADPQAAAQEFLEKESEYLRIRVSREQPIRVGDLFAYRVEAEASGGGVTTSSEVTWLAYRGLMYQLSFVARGGGVRKYQGRARSTVRSFRPLTARDRSSVRETRIEIATAEGGETLEALSARTGNVLEVGVTAVLNALDVSEQLPEGYPVKIATSGIYQGRPDAPVPEAAEPSAEELRGGEEGG